MEIQAWMFLAFWAVASTVFLDLGFRVLDNTQLSESVSPVVMSLFKHSFAISSCLSSSYALVFRGPPRYDSRSQYLLLLNVIVSLFLRRTIDGIIFIAIFSKIWSICAPFLDNLYLILIIVFIFALLGFILYICPAYFIFLLIYSSVVVYLDDKGIITYKSKYEIYEELGLIPIIESMWRWVWGVCLCIISVLVLLYICRLFLEEHSRRVVILVFLHSYLFFVGGEKTDFSPILVVFFSHLILVVSSMKEGRFQKLVRVVSKVRKACSRFEDKRGLFREFIEIIIGLTSSILFLKFFKVTSLNEALAFVCFAAMWLANLALLGVGGDFGVFFFLLFNMVVGSMQNEFALRRNTWLAYGFAILLSAIHLYLKSVTVNYGIGQYIKIPCDWFIQRSTPTENEGSDFELEVKVE